MLSYLLRHVLLAHLLHLLADLGVDVKELGNAAIDTDGLALGKVVLRVFARDTLGIARIDNTRVNGQYNILQLSYKCTRLPIEQIRYHFKFLLSHRNVLRVHSLLRLHTITKERHFRLRVE